MTEKTLSQICADSLDQVREWLESCQLVQDLVDHEEVGAKIAESNADGWRVDFIEVENVTYIGSIISIIAQVNLIGDQDPDKAVWLTQIRVTVRCLTKATHDDLKLEVIGIWTDIDSVEPEELEPDEDEPDEDDYEPDEDDEPEEEDEDPM